MPVSSYRGRPRSRGGAHCTTSLLRPNDALVSAGTVRIRSPKKGHGGRGTGLHTITLAPPPPEPAAHTRRRHTSRRREGGTALPPGIAAHGTVAPGRIARGIGPLTKGVATSNRLRGARPTTGPGPRPGGTRQHPRSRGLMRRGGHARPTGRTTSLALASLSRIQGPHPHGAARRLGGLGPAPNPHQLTVGGDRRFLRFHGLVLSRRARTSPPATPFSSCNGYRWAGHRPGRGGDRAGRSQVAASPQITRSWFTTRRPCL